MRLRRLVLASALVAVVPSCANPSAAPATSTGSVVPARGPDSSTTEPSLITTTTEPATTSTTTTITTTTTTLPAGDERFAVASFWQDYTDATRNRTLKTRVHYPAKGTPGTVGTAKADGAFPLVLMAHGYLLPAGGYEKILMRVAAAGYVVAAPAFPHTSQETGDGNRGDIVNQPADLSFTADTLTAESKAAGSRLPGIADPNRIAILGHSDGGLTATAFAYDAQYRDPRVAAAVVMTGGIALFPGNYFTTPPFAPMLAIHGTTDGTNGYNASVGLFNRVPSGTPHFLVSVEGGAHIEPYMFDSALPELGQVIVDFLDAFLVGTPGATERLQRDADVPNRLRIQTA